MDKAFLMALRHDYLSCCNPEEMSFWQFAAFRILEAWKENHDDSCFDWRCGVVSSHLPAILAECPELANDEDSLAYQE